MSSSFSATFCVRREAGFGEFCGVFRARPDRMTEMAVPADAPNEAQSGR